MLNKKNILSVFIVNLYFNSIVFAADYNIQTNSNSKTNLINSHQICQEKSHVNTKYNSVASEDNLNYNYNEKLFFLSFNEKTNRQMLFIILDEELNSHDFNRINGNYIGVKLLVVILAIVSSGTENLLLTNNKNITAEPIIATQIGVPICTENMYLVIDDFMLSIKNGVLDLIKKAFNNKVKFIFIISKITISLTLAYLAAIVETETAGDGYHWLFSHMTSNDRILNIAYYFGRYLRLLFSLNLYGVFFNQLIDEFLSKTGLGYLVDEFPAPTENFNQLIMQKHVKKMITMVNSEDMLSSRIIITNYIKSHNLNSSFDIADMQNILTNRTINFSKKYNLFINLSKIIFIGATTAFCGIAFKQMFSARLMLENFVDHIGKHNNGSILFNLKNGSEISCNTVINCVQNLDFTSIKITDAQTKELLHSDDIAVMSSMLSGISIASCAAVIILTAIDSTIKLAKNSRYKKALKTAYLKHNNLLPYLFCIFFIPPLYYGIKNIIDTYPIAKKYSMFLDSIGDNQILTTEQALIIATSCVAITIAKYIPFVANLPRAIKYLITKLARTMP